MVVLNCTSQTYMTCLRKYHYYSKTSKNRTLSRMGKESGFLRTTDHRREPKGLREFRFSASPVFMGYPVQCARHQ